MQTIKLSILKKVIEIGSLTTAAEELGYTQPALTSMMKSLETELNVPLLERSRNGIRLTNQGLKLKPYIENVLAAEEELLTMSKELSNTSFIKIGCFETMALYILPQVIKLFKESHPYVDIEIKTYSSISNKLFKNNSIDFAIADKFYSSQLDWVSISNERICAVIPKSFAISATDNIDMEELLQYPILIPSLNPESFTNRLLKGKNVANRIEIATSNAQTMLHFVSQDLGVAFMSDFFKPYIPENCIMVPILPETTREIGIITSSYHNLQTIAKEFIQLLMQNYK